MARLIRLTALAPLKIEAKDIPPGKAISICTCGLSQKFPLCDGAHKAARVSEQPGMLYTYDASRTSVVASCADEVGGEATGTISAMPPVPPAPAAPSPLV